MTRSKAICVIEIRAKHRRVRTRYRPECFVLRQEQSVTFLPREKSRPGNLVIRVSKKIKFSISPAMSDVPVAQIHFK